MIDTWNDYNSAAIRVVVLDDEEKVCRLVIQLGEWEKYSMEIAGTAYNGLEGYNLIKTIEPDLVITDIRMPGLDGLELIEKAKNDSLETEFVIISGHHQFEYAHNAIRFGVEDYLLKPIKEQELNETLERIFRKFKDKRTIEQRTSVLQQRLNSSREKLRKNFFQDYLFSRISRGELTLEQINEAYGYTFAPGVFQVVQIKLDCRPETYSEKMMHMVTGKAEHLGHLSLLSDCQDMEMEPSGSSIYLLLNYRIEKAEDIRRKLRELNSEMIANSRLFESARISMSLGKAVEGPSYLIESRKSSDQAMGERLIREEGIRIFEEAPSAGRGSCDRILAEWNRKMESICDLLDPEAGKGAVDDLLNRLYGEECSGVMVLETLREAGHRFFLLLKDRGEENYNSLKSSFDRDLNLLAGYREFQEYLRNLIYSCFQEMKESREQADSQPVRDAKIFISTNYKDNSISLEKVAQSIDLSPSYFSSLFKQQTGEGFLDYLTSIRVEEAKELLRTSRMTVSAVASEVGYSDTKYFTRLFKKLTGIKPSEFRKIYG